MFFPYFHKKKIYRDRSTRFHNAIKLAQDIVTVDSCGLVTLIRLVSSSLQAKTTTSAVMNGLYSAREADSFSSLFFDEWLPVSKDGRTCAEIAAHTDDVQYAVRLGVDPVIATPWQRTWLVRALATIGYGKTQGPWQQDHQNHQLTLVLPFGISLVGGGNHSLTAGITNGEGVVVTNVVKDITPIYEHVYYDGLCFRRTWDGAVLSQPNDEEPGILFEIGRLMIQHRVAPGVEIVAHNSSPVGKLSGGDGYYKVLINGKDAGVAMSTSGAEHFLRSSGISKNSELWNQVLRSQSHLVRVNYVGEEEQIHLVWSIRRRVVDSLNDVHGVLGWVEPDDD